jgi:hypothetical protein
VQPLAGVWPCRWLLGALATPVVALACIYVCILIHISTFTPKNWQHVASSTRVASAEPQFKPHVSENQLPLGKGVAGLASGGLLLPLHLPAPPPCGVLSQRTVGPHRAQGRQTSGAAAACCWPQTDYEARKGGIRGGRSCRRGSNSSDSVLGASQWLHTGPLKEPPPGAGRRNNERCAVARCAPVRPHPRGGGTRAATPQEEASPGAAGLLHAGAVQHTAVRSGLRGPVDEAARPSAGLLGCHAEQGHAHWVPAGKGTPFRSDHT